MRDLHEYEWETADVQYDDFQVARWTSDGDAELVVERGMGPNPGGFDVVYEEGDTFVTIDTGLTQTEALERAVTEAGVPG